jgi:hypothetical protein
MKIFINKFGNEVRLTDERLEHILQHPEMKDMTSKIEDTLADPEIIVRSRSDDDVSLYNKLYLTELFGYKYLCVVVKELENDNFILTSFIMNNIPKGEVIWQRK